MKNMKSQNTSNFMTVALSTTELWYLVQLFGPGWVFGVDDPTKNLSKDKVVEMETKAFNSLSKEGMIEHAGGNQLRIDEMLGGMVYSLLHSKHLLVVKDLSNGNERFFHFLPQWQLELCRMDDHYELTLFRERSDLFQHILYVHDAKLDASSDGYKFSIPARELELSAFLFDSGKADQALANLEVDIIEIPSAKKFLEGYLKPDYHFRFDLLLNREDEERIHTTRNELLQLDDILYWISYDEAGEEAVEMMNFTSVTPQKAERRFNLMLPGN
jgi:hypothetical protein